MKGHLEGPKTQIQETHVQFTIVPLQHLSENQKYRSKNGGLL